MENEIKLDSLDEVLADVKAGRPVVIIDDDDRECEGDIMLAGELATPETINFTLQHGRGLVCLSLQEERMRELGFPLQSSEYAPGFMPNFGVSFDHRSVAGAGITASARARTIVKASSKHAVAEDFSRPGYVFPLSAVPGGVLKRRGHTEASVDLAKVAGLLPAAVICEVVGSDGKLLRGETLKEFCEEHQLRVTSVESIVQHRLRNEVSVRRVADVHLSEEIDSICAKLGVPAIGEELENQLRLVVYLDDVDDKEHLAIIFGDLTEEALVRIHSECLTGDVFESQRCDCGAQFNKSLEEIVAAGSGVIVYLAQEGRGIGLGNKLKAYALQDRGLDTVDANVELGFLPDERDFRVGAHILTDLGLKRVQILTNNPAKVDALERFGVQVTSRVEMPGLVDKHNRAYLEAKRSKMGHLIPE